MLTTFFTDLIQPGFTTGMPLLVRICQPSAGRAEGGNMAFDMNFSSPDVLENQSPFQRLY
jgi:hypothetical protein